MKKSKRIKLRNGDYAIVDIDDYDKLKKLSWGVLVIKGVKTYAVTSMYNPKRTVYMHRLVLNVPLGTKKYIDHINRNKLDNRKENLRFCDRSQNYFNRGAIKSNKYGYKGVSYDKDRKKYSAQIVAYKKHFNLGLYDTSKEAGIAYNVASRLLHKEFAFINKI